MRVAADEGNYLEGLDYETDEGRTAATAFSP